REAITLYTAIYPKEAVKPNLVTICPPNSTACIDPRYPPRALSHSKPLSTGALVGIVIGALVLLIAIVLAGIFFLLRRRRTHDSKVQYTGETTKPSEQQAEGKQPTVALDP